MKPNRTAILTAGCVLVLGMVGRDLAASQPPGQSDQPVATRPSVLAAMGLTLGLTGLVATVVLWLRSRRQREQDQIALEKAQRAWDELFQHAPYGYHAVDEAGIFTVVNDTEAVWLGYAPEDLLRKINFRELIQPEHRAAYDRVRADVSAGAPRRSLNLVLVTKQGRALPVLLHSPAHRAVPTPEGPILWSLQSLADVRTEPTELELAFETVREAVVATDAAGRILRMNPSAEALTGWSRAEAAGRLIRDVVQLEPWPLAASGAGPAAEASRVGTELEGACRATLRALDGTLRPVAERIAPLRGPTGEPWGALHIFESAVPTGDAAAELRRCRALLENLLATLPGRYLVLKPDLTIVGASDAYLRSSGIPRDQLLGNGLFEVWRDNPDGTNKALISNLQASLDRVRQHGVVDALPIQSFEHRQPDGSYRSQRWSLVNTPVLGFDRRIDYILHRVEEVTGKTFSTEASPENTARGGEASAPPHGAIPPEKLPGSGDTDSGVTPSPQISFGHDAESTLRNRRLPLPQLNEVGELLQQRRTPQPDRDREHRYSSMVSGAARQMGQLMLGFSRMGCVTMQLEHVELELLFREAQQALRPEARGRSIIWKHNSLPRVQGDPAMLRQVCVILLGNAIKFTRPRNPARIEIGCLTDSPGEVTVYVRDNGVGFDATQATQLFSVFRRLHSAAEFEGSGIGLANARRIITRHGGRTWAEGSVGEGARFFFTLPLKPAAPSAPPVA